MKGVVMGGLSFFGQGLSTVDITPSDLRRSADELNRLVGEDFTNGGSMDFALLEDTDEYVKYFAQQLRVIKILLSWCHKIGNDAGNQTGIIIDFLKRFSYTLECLRMKYVHNNQHRLRVDLTESGFPNFIEPDNLRIDLLQRDERLASLPGSDRLKKSALEYMFSHLAEAEDILAILGERSYFSMLTEDKLFLPFTAGELAILKSDNPKARYYSFAWACFDFATNRPYLYLMHFAYDNDCEPLEERGQNWKEFRHIITNVGSRAPQLGILALDIDDRLANVHPKAVRRISLGPLYSKFLCNNPSATADKWQEAWCRIMTEFSRKEDDFVLLLTEEEVISERQEVYGRPLRRKVREIFKINELSMECLNRQVSAVKHYCVLPHCLLQQAVNDPQLCELGFAGFKCVTFNGEDSINGR
jgi:hypothetical protein